MEGDALRGEGQKLLQELRQIRDTASYRAHRDFIQREITYFTDNGEHMHYDRCRARRLPMAAGVSRVRAKTLSGAA
jgi:hypothetical protein